MENEGHRMKLLRGLAVCLLSFAACSYVWADQCCEMEGCPGGPPPNYCEGWCLGGSMCVYGCGFMGCELCMPFVCACSGVPHCACPNYCNPCEQPPCENQVQQCSCGRGLECACARACSMTPHVFDCTAENCFCFCAYGNCVADPTCFCSVSKDCSADGCGAGPGVVLCTCDDYCENQSPDCGGSYNVCTCAPSPCGCVDRCSEFAGGFLCSYGPCECADHCGCADHCSDDEQCNENAQDCIAGGKGCGLSMCQACGTVCPDGSRPCSGSNGTCGCLGLECIAHCGQQNLCPSAGGVGNCGGSKFYCDELFG